ncbi:MAG TPA: hypothetical protein VLJ16_11075 [Acidobacteriota bacterium]|nr:hypothetical protein [Acidobacteriota bacterium]
MFNKIFPFLHLAALLAVLVYAVVSLFHRNVPRFALIILLLGLYYIFLLHPAVKKEIARRRSLKKP